MKGIFFRSSSCILYRRSCELACSVVVTQHTQRIIVRSLGCRLCRSDEVGAHVPLACLPLGVMENEREARMRTWAGAHWRGPILLSTLWWRRVHSRHPRIISPQGSRRMAPPQCSPFPLWPLSLVIYRSGQSSTSLNPKYGIGLQSARDYIAYLAYPTGPSDTEAGFGADTQETYCTGVFAGPLNHIESLPNSINMVQYNSYNPKLTI